MERALLCEGLEVFYGSYCALKNVSLDLPMGSLLSVVGLNGSGKTTFIKALLGLVHSSGHREILSKNIGYLPQVSTIKKNFPATVEEIALSGATDHLFFNKNDKEMARYWVEELGLNDLMKKSFSSLSGGQKQRVLLSRALTALKCPLLSSGSAVSSLLVLDEPMSGLDPLISDALYETLEKIRRDWLVTIVMVSHDVVRALKSATHILHLKKAADDSGSLLFFGNSDEYKGSKAFHFLERVEVCCG